MKKCYRCETNLDAANSTHEHIIINACGGRLKSKYLLCLSCNSFYGGTFDKELAAQTNDLVNILGVQRQRGQALPVKGISRSTGDEYYFHVDDKIERVKPKILFSGEGVETRMTIETSNIKTLKQVLNGYKRKHPQIDIQAAINSAKESFERVDGEIKFQNNIGGDEVFKAITKTAINFYIYKLGHRKYIEHLLPFLDGLEKQDVTWMHYPDNLIYTTGEREVSHVICLVGDPEEKILYAYIELFNCHNYLIKLNEFYTGKAINESFIFDIIERKTIDANPTISYNRQQLLDFFTHKNYKPFVNVQKAMHRVIELSRIFSLERKKDLAFWNAWNNSLGKYPEGTVITDEMAAEFRTLYLNHIIPLLNFKHP